MIARQNPFRTERVLSVRYRLSAVEREALLLRFEQLGRRAALVGKRGSGKTTLLEDLAPALEGKGFTVRFLTLNEEHPNFEPDVLEHFFQSLGASDVILVDGAEQLGWWRWRRFLKRIEGAAGLLITSHASGLLPTLFECKTTPELFSELVAQLVGAEATAQLPLRDLFDTHGGNVRDALRALYDLQAAATTTQRPL